VRDWLFVINTVCISWGTDYFTEHSVFCEGLIIFTEHSLCFVRDWLFLLSTVCVLWGTDYFYWTHSVFCEGLIICTEHSVFSVTDSFMKLCFVRKMTICNKHTERERESVCVCVCVCNTELSFYVNLTHFSPIHPTRYRNNKQATCWGMLF